MRQGATQTGGRGYSDDSKEPMWCNGSILAQNDSDVGSSPALGTVFPIFSTHMTIVKFECGTCEDVEIPWSLGVARRCCRVMSFSWCYYACCI